MIVGLLAGAASLALPRLLVTVENPIEVGALVLALGLFAMELAPGAVPLGVALVVIASHVPAHLRWVPWTTTVAGTVLVAVALPSDSVGWLRAATIAFCLLYGWLGWFGSSKGSTAQATEPQFDRLWLWLMAITAGGIYAAVADTEQITAVAVWLVVIAGAGQLRWLVAGMTRMAAFSTSCGCVLGCRRRSRGAPGGLCRSRGLFRHARMPWHLEVAP